MVQIVFLCGGVGRRFGSSLWMKPLNKVEGVSLMEHTLRPFVEAGFSIWIAHNENLGQQGIQRIVGAMFPKAQNSIRFFQLPYLTQGAVESGYLAVQAMNRKEQTEPILFFDNDAIYSKEMIQQVVRAAQSLPPHSALLGTAWIDDPQPCYCYVETETREGEREREEEEGTIEKVVRIREKEVISHIFGIGIYGFQSGQFFLDEAHQMIQEDRRMKQEFYFSSLLDAILEKNRLVQSVRSDTWPTVLGTPEQIRSIKHTLPRKTLRFVISHHHAIDHLDWIDDLLEQGHEVRVLTPEEEDAYDFRIDPKSINPTHPDWKQWMGFE